MEECEETQRTILKIVKAEENCRPILLASHIFSPRSFHASGVFTVALAIAKSSIRHNGEHVSFGICVAIFRYTAFRLWWCFFWILAVSVWLRSAFSPSRRNRHWPVKTIGLTCITYLQVRRTDPRTDKNLDSEDPGCIYRRNIQFTDP